jgi:hypothetical protein
MSFIAFKMPFLICASNPTQQMKFLRDGIVGIRTEEVLRGYKFPSKPVLPNKA